MFSFYWFTCIYLYVTRSLWNVKGNVVRECQWHGCVTLIRKRNMHVQYWKYHVCTQFSRPSRTEHIQCFLALVNLYYPILKCDRKLFLLLVSISKRSMLVYSKPSAIRATCASRHELMNDSMTHINLSGEYAWHNTLTMVSATHEIFAYDHCSNWSTLCPHFRPTDCPNKI